MQQYSTSMSGYWAIQYIQYRRLQYINKSIMYEYRILLHPLQPPNFYAEIKFIVGTVFVAVARLFARPEMNRFQRTTFRGILFAWEEEEEEKIC